MAHARNTDLPAELIWSPTISSHNPNPPLTLDSVVHSGVFAIVGSSTSDFDARRRLVARCSDAFEFLPLPIPVHPVPGWLSSLRREPAIGIKNALNSADSSTFRDTNEPILGEDVQLNLGFGTLQGGVVQFTEISNDGDADGSWAWDARIADYMFVVNRRRPFMCFDDVSASTAIAEMWASFGPHPILGFTTDIEAGLPTISAEFDGSRTFEECCSVVSRLVGGAKFKVTADKVFIFKFDDPVLPAPEQLNNTTNETLQRSTLRMSKDSSQLRNRVFVRGASARLLDDVLAGATSMNIIDGVDSFSDTGGEAIIGCDRFSYTGTIRSLVNPPLPDEMDALVKSINPDASTYTPGSPSASFDDAQEGAIGTRVRYSVTYVVNGDETPRGSTTIIAPEQVNIGVGWAGGFPGVRQIVAGDGFAIGDAALFGWVTHSGKVVVNTRFSVGFANALNMTPSKHIYGPYPTQGVNTTHPDPRVASFRLWRKMTWLDAFWHEVITTPEGGTPIDVKDPASLGQPPSVIEDVFNGHETQNDSGSKAWITYVPLGPDGTSERRVYREENFGAGSYWTEPKLVMTVNGNAQLLGPIEDTSPTSTHFWERGTNIGTPTNPIFVPPEETNPAPTAPSKQKPKVRLTLTGVTGLDEDHAEGDAVYIFTQRDDVAAQAETAALEGGNGIHEGFVSDELLKSNSMLVIRGNAELSLWARPIVTVTYQTRDRDTKVGADIDINMTEPPVVANLRIQEVSISQIHENDETVELYTATASSVKFTLEDLLRRALLRE